MKQAIIGSHVVQKVMPAPGLEKRFFFLAADYILFFVETLGKKVYIYTVLVITNGWTFLTSSISTHKNCRNHLKFQNRSYGYLLN